jgi:four helix bundle protein
MRDYRKIHAWQKSDDLTVDVYRATKRFPREEIYGLTSQLRRAAYSVPANIAEGATRNSKKDYLRFLYIARASLAETQYFLHLSKRLNYLTKEENEELQSATSKTFSKLHGLIKSVEKEAGVIRRTVSASLAILMSQIYLKGL